MHLTLTNIQPACSFLRYRPYFCRHLKHNRVGQIFKIDSISLIGNLEYTSPPLFLKQNSALANYHSCFLIFVTDK